MQYSVKALKGYAIGATDDDIGKLDDFYFDDESWTIRYLVAETGNWLLNRKVLISPFSLGKADLSRKRLNVTLTKKQVEESPSIDTDKPVSRQHEASYLDYYGYPYYWGGPYLWGPMTYPRFSGAAQRRNEEARAEREEANDLHLLSRGTLWGAFNSVTEHTDHMMLSGDSTTRLNSIWFGHGEQLKVKAFHLAEQMMRA